MIRGKYFHLGWARLVIRLIKYLDDHEMLHWEHKVSKKFEVFAHFFSISNVIKMLASHVMTLSGHSLGVFFMYKGCGAQMSQWNVSSVICELQPPSDCIGPHLIRVSMMQIGLNTIL